MYVQTVSLDDRIRVAVIFQNGKIKPVWFDRKGIKHEVKELCSNWSSREGRTLLMHFSVWDGHNCWALTYNTSTQVWKLGQSIQEKWPIKRDSM